MTKAEAEAALRELRKKYPQITEISVGYYGAGDSFNSFAELDIEGNGDVDENEIGDLLWYAIENSDANFNDEGCQGRVIITLRPTLSIEVEVEHYVTTTETGDGYFVEFDDSDPLEQIFEI